MKAIFTHELKSYFHSMTAYDTHPSAFLWSLRGFFWQDKRNLSEWVCRAFVPASHLARLRAMPPAAWPATRSVAHRREGKKYAAGRYARRRGARDGT